MPSVTLSPEADVATWSSGLSAGTGNHLPVGDYGSANYRSAIRWDAPSWSGWTTITKATLNIYTSDFDHVGPRNSSIYVRRQTVASLWTSGEGSQNCESGFAAGQPVDYDDVSPGTTGQVSFSSGTTANAKKSVTVTGLVDYYRTQGASKIVLVLDEVGSGDYSEFWSRHKTGGYDITLVIEYEDNAPPTAPTITAPASGAISVPTTVRLDWTHNDPDGDAQANAEVRIWNSAGTTQVGSTIAIAGSTSLYDWTGGSRGTGYQFDVRTYDGEFWSPWSAKRAFSIKALPVVTITNTRFMSYSGGPRLTVKWTVTGGTQARWRVQCSSPAYDSGWQNGTATSHLLNVGLTNGSAAPITVTIETSDVLQDSDVRSFTPRWGLTVHRRDLGTDPVTGWGTPTVSSSVPSGATLTVEYNANATGSVPTTWFSSLASAPKARYVFYRAWFIPSATAGPTLSSIVIPANFAAERIDHWFGTYAGAVLGGQWSVDTSEYVYGSRSVTCENNGVTQGSWSEVIHVREGRSYILTGLMRSEGNSGACIQLYEANGGLNITQDGVNVQTDILTASREWFEPDQLDVYRYRSPIWVASGNIDVQVRLRSSGAAGTQSWFDAIKLEESTVATPWTPAAVGAVIVDAGGVQVDGTKGGVFRLRGSTGGVRDIVELGPRGLVFGGNTAIWDGQAGELYVQNANGNNLIRLIGVAGEAAGVYTAFMGQRATDTTGRFLLGYEGALQQTGLFIGTGAASRDVQLYREGPGALSLNGNIIIGGSSTYQSITLRSGGTDAGGTLFDHGTGSSIYGRIVAYAAGGTAYEIMRWDSTTGGRIGFYGAGAPTVGRQTVSGARGSNAALQSLLNALHSLGLINNTTTT